MNTSKSGSGKAKGALAVAAKMTDAERKARAKKAAAARWEAKAIRAINKGNFDKHFGVDVECYVLNDAARTAVISQRGMGIALGLGASGSRLPSFVNGRVIAPYIGDELRRKLDTPLIFEASGADGASMPPSLAHGYDVTVLIDVCKAVLDAKAAGKLLKQQEKVAEQAAIIVAASAKSGIRGLVYALAGYTPSASEVIQAFKLYVQEEAKKYEKEFPDELYAEWYRLYDLPVPDRGRPWHFSYLTKRHIYYPLAKSQGKILELLTALRDRDPQKNKLFTFLSDTGTRALRMHMGRVLEMAESSASKEQYERKIEARFGEQQMLPLPEPDADN